MIKVCDGDGCLKVWAVIGKHGSLRLSRLGSQWSEQICSTGVQKLNYSINIYFKAIHKTYFLEGEEIIFTIS